MSTDFKVFKTAIAAQFHQMQKTTLYRTAVDGEHLWNLYLNSFPEGTNPMYRERTEHDCSACRSFIKHIGNVVTIVDGKLVSLWDVKVPTEPAYQAVADALAAVVKAASINDLFLHAEPKVGLDKNVEQILGRDQTWSHFFVNLPSAVVVSGASVAAKLAEPRMTHDVMLRGLNEITRDAISTTLELIAQNSLERGAEHKWAVTEFEKLKIGFDKITSDAEKDLYVWSRVTALKESVSRMRNTVIGTFLVDLSTGVALETAVDSFGKKMSPLNYKRPTSLVTASMLKSAQEEIERLGLMSALQRRVAVIGDITIPNVLFADRSSRPKMAGNVFEEIASTMPEKPKNYDKVEEVTMQNFIANVLPRAESIEVLLENRHVGNLVTLLGPEDPTAGQLFQWNNAFSWDYEGNVADSIKERVKKAGGSVTGDLCCRLAWSNTDDLDFHMIEPSGHEIYYAAKRSRHTDGQLDVDMNASSPVNNPVENIYYGSRQSMTAGVYKLLVHQYRQRTTQNGGFEVEIDYLGDVLHFTYDKVVKQGERVLVAEFRYTHAKGIEILNSLEAKEFTKTKTVWGLPTQTFHKVNVMMYSPNYWDGQGVGNRHYFMMLEGALRDGPARGFYNEFLKAELNPHRKAFELVGSRMKSEGTAEQLSGLGFSTTKNDSIVVRVKGATSRVLKIKI